MKDFAQIIFCVSKIALCIIAIAFLLLVCKELIFGVTIR